MPRISFPLRLERGEGRGEVSIAAADERIVHEPGAGGNINGAAIESPMLENPIARSVPRCSNTHRPPSQIEKKHDERELIA
jgi:hypothetical protein